MSLIGKPLPTWRGPTSPLTGDLRVGDPKLVLTRIEWRSDWGDTGKCSVATFLADNRESLSAKDREAVRDIREGQTVTVMGGGATVTYPKRTWATPEAPKAPKATKPAKMKIVLAWTTEEQQVEREGSTWRMPTFKTVRVPRAAMWKLRGDEKDLAKARIYAAEQSKSSPHHVFTYPTAERDPLGRAKKDVMR